MNISNQILTEKVENSKTEDMREKKKAPNDIEKRGDLNTGQRLSEMKGEDEDNRPGSHCRKGLDV